MQVSTEKRASPPRLLPAATLILARDSEAGPQVYLLKRSERARFMPGMYVFPGGRVDRADREVGWWLPRTDLDGAEIAVRFRDDRDGRDNLAFVVAAIRETLEECGVLLARANGGDPLPDAAQLQAEAAGAHGEWFQERVAAGDWRLRVSRLESWQRWQSPESLPIRFDVRYFVAPMPPDQTCRPDQHEMVAGCWRRPVAALEENFSGRLPLSPPTLVTLHQLSRFRSVAELLTAARRRPRTAPILPRLLPVDGGQVYLEPWDPLYGERRPAFDPAVLDRSLLPVGAPFSRLWQRGRVCRPVDAGEAVPDPADL